MIASDRCAQRVGTALLVADGAQEALVRRAEISIRPTRGQAQALERGLLRLSRDAYNAALEHRREAWRLQRVSISTYDQFGEIDDELRSFRPDVARFGVQPVRSAIRRADEAMTAFYRRVKDGESPGYPRFKSHRRFRTVFYDEPVSWKLRRLDGSAPALYLQGVGEVSLSASATRQLRRMLGRGGEPRILTITKSSSGGWRASVVFRGVAQRRLPHSNQIGGVDRGVAVSAALPDGTLLKVPDFVEEARAAIADLQRRRDQTAEFSSEWKHFNRKIAKAYRKARDRSENWARHTARYVVERYGVIALEKLDLRSMTRSAKGTKEAPGTNVNAKRGLNRSLHDAALGRLADWICVKAEEAGRRVWKVNPRRSSQECAACGHTERANRFGTRFCCLMCGYSAHADVNAAQVLTCRGYSAEALWKEMGAPANVRPKPRLKRRRNDIGAAPLASRTGSGRPLTR